MDELERKEQELKEAMDEITRNGFILAESFEKVSDETEDMEKRLKDFQYKVQDYTRRLGGIGRDFDQNKGKMSAFSNVVGLGADALGELGIAGEMAGQALMAIANMTFEEVDQTMANFQKMGSIGAVGADGMTEFRLSAHAARLTMDQFADIVTKNAKGLALATGNTLDGARALSEITQAASETGLRGQLMNLGIGIEQQSDFFADYFAQIRRLGLQQNRDFRSQTTAVGTYVKQLTLLSRLTGDSIEGAKAQLEAQQRSARFEGAMQALAQQFGPEYANRIRTEVAALGDKLGPAGEAMLMDIFAGPNTQAAKDFLVTFGDQGRQAINLANSGQLALGELSEMIVQSGLARREQLGGPGRLALLAETGAIDSTVNALLSVPKATELTVESLQKQMDAINAGASGADELTKNLNKAAEESQNAAVALESTRDLFLNIGSTVLPAFSTGIRAATEALNDLTKGLGFGLEERASGGPVTGGAPYLVGEAGPEIVIPNASGTVIPNDQLVAMFNQVQQIGQGSSLVDGLSRTFMPGIGFANRMQQGGLDITKITDFAGAEIASKVSYSLDTMLGNMSGTASQYTAGPRDSYANQVFGQDVISAITMGEFGGKKSTVYGEGDMMKNESLFKQMTEALTAELRTIAANTKSGADTTKQLLRSTAG